MKKRGTIGALVILLIVAIGAILVKSLLGTHPFRDLTPEDIASASVELLPPGKELPVEDLEALAALLSEVVIYRKDNSYGDYNGQTVIFTLTMTDGSTVQVSAYNPFLIIDGVGYRTKYESCEALSHFANSLLP